MKWNETIIEGHYQRHNECRKKGLAVTAQQQRCLCGRHTHMSRSSSARQPSHTGRGGGVARQQEWGSYYSRRHCACREKWLHLQSFISLLCYVSQLCTTLYISQTSVHYGVDVLCARNENTVNYCDYLTSLLFIITTLFCLIHLRAYVRWWRELNTLQHKKTIKWRRITLLEITKHIHQFDNTYAA